MRKEYISALFPVLDIGAFGFYLQMFTPGKIEDARNIDEEPINPFFLEYSTGASFSRSFLKNSVSIGANLSFVESRIDEATGRGVYGGLNLRYSPHPFLLSHLYLLTFGTPISYSGAINEKLPAEGGLTITLNPLYASDSTKKRFDFDITAGVRKISDEPLTLGISSKINTNFYLNFSAGYEHPLGTALNLEGFSLGMGLKYKSFEFTTGWRMFSDLFGNIWAFSFVYNTEELKKPTAEDYYVRTLRHYKKGRFYLATINAKKALKLDPNMWKAHALLNRIRSQILRNKNLEVALIYTANSDGNFVALSKDAIGGFDRMGYVIKSLLEEYPATLLIEGGNLFKREMDIIHSKFALEYLDYIKYDAIGTGAGEIAYGLEEILNICGEKIKFILSNSTESIGNIIKYKIVERKGYRFFIASLLNPSLITAESQNKLKLTDSIELLNLSKKCDVRILILHDSWENIQNSPSYLNNFDIVICSNLEAEFHTPLKKGNVLLLSAGSKGKYVGVLTLEFDSNKKITNVNNRLIPLINNTPRDTFLSRKLSKFEIIDSSKYNNLLNLSLKNSDGVFPFVSDRDGRPVIYVKDMHQLADFPITKTYLKRCERPVLSFVNSRIVFKVKDYDGCYKLKCTMITDTAISFFIDSIEVDDIAFTPDGEWIYFSGSKCNTKDKNIFRVKSIGGSFFEIIKWDSSAENSIAFSPYDSIMAFCSNRDGTIQIYLTNFEGEKPIRLTDDNNSNYLMPKFSPNGKYIAYLSDINNFSGHLDLWVFDRTKGKHKRITERADVKEFCWLLDSRHIVFTLKTGTKYELIKTDILKYRFTKLVSTDMYKNWDERYPYVIKYNDEENIIYTREYRENKEKQIFLIKTDGTEDRKIVDSNGSDWLSEF
ncbi:MAG: hypothetical protein N2053_04475 [Chitinispirillaceae bacterium]|nr:hypothetical protein [Chitinispirillaceae bacterium]